MRHAKAEASAPSDFERRLTDRGHADAEETGAWLGGQDVVPDDALISAAVRTTQTWEDVASGAGWELEVAQSVGGHGVGDVDLALAGEGQLLVDALVLDLARRVEVGLDGLGVRHRDVGGRQRRAGAEQQCRRGRGADQREAEGGGVAKGHGAVSETVSSWRG